MYCRNCGSDIENSKFCPNCGAKQEFSAPQQPRVEQYQQYSSNANYAPKQNSVPDMSVGDWVLTIFLTMIPLVGFILLIVWAAGSNDDKVSRKNWAIANLIWTIILVIIGMVIGIVLAMTATTIPTPEHLL